MRFPGCVLRVRVSLLSNFQRVLFRCVRLRDCVCAHYLQVCVFVTNWELWGSSLPFQSPWQPCVESLPNLALLRLLAPLGFSFFQKQLTNTLTISAFLRLSVNLCSSRWKGKAEEFSQPLGLVTLYSTRPCLVRYKHQQRFPFFCQSSQSCALFFWCSFEVKWSEDSSSS